MFKRLLFVFAILSSPMTASAALIDFTDISWKHAIIDGGGSTATVGDVKLTATGGYLTFNAWDNGGCKAGQPGNGLTCHGDGIGINNDEITQGGNQAITIDFLNPVNVTDIILLDLFGKERSGEIAVIDGTEYHAYSGTNDFPGGYFATGFSASAITSIMLTGYTDYFSDYALAAVDISPVPIPGAVFLFGSALLGFMGFKRFSK